MPASAFGQRLCASEAHVVRSAKRLGFEPMDMCGGRYAENANDRGGATMRFSHPILHAAPDRYGFSHPLVLYVHIAFTVHLRVSSVYAQLLIGRSRYELVAYGRGPLRDFDRFLRIAGEQS